MKTDGKKLFDFQTNWEKLVDKGFSDYKSLSPDERIWFNIQTLIGQVDNGGLISHYYNSGADYNSETIDDLTTLGFHDIADLLNRINNLFSGGKPSIDIDERNDVISNWPDGKYDHLLDQLDKIFYKKEKDLENRLIMHIESKLLAE